jgi:hypothetical protein
VQYKGDEWDWDYQQRMKRRDAALLLVASEHRIIEAYKTKLADVKYKAEYEAKLQALKAEYGVDK